jgi:hypothetical protein
MATEPGGESLDVLQQEQGAQMIYRVTQQESSVRIEGRAGSRTCVFEAEKPGVVQHALLGDGPRYTFASPQLGEAVAEVAHEDAAADCDRRSWMG